jgi:hypothetical protein
MKKLLPIYTERLKIIETSVDDINLILKMDRQEDTQLFLGGIKNKSREERLDFLSRKKNSLTVLLDDVRIGFVGLKINEDKALQQYRIELAKQIYEQDKNLFKRLSDL